MNKDVRLNWIAEAEARHFEVSALTQHALSEPQVAVVLPPPAAAQRHWVRRLVAHLAGPAKFAGPMDDPGPALRAIASPKWPTAKSPISRDWVRARRLGEGPG